MVFPQQATSPLTPPSGGLPPGSIVAGKYRIERPLGHGGMGDVYLGLHTQLGRRVAIKTLRAQALPMADLRARFQREAMAAATLTSEHIAQVFDVGELPDGSPFMVMEYLEGHDLAAVLQQRGALPLAEALDYLRQACAGVAVAHASGVVHRDLKPANLFVVPRPGGPPLVKVLDFGIAKAPLLMSSIHTLLPSAGPGAAPTSLTRTDSLLGSVRYMAPEQMESARDVDARADVWSLGVIAYRLLSGHYPFAGDRPEEIFVAAVRTRPTPLSALRPDVSPALAQIVDACLQPDRNRRCPSVVALQQALASVSVHAPLYAPPYGPPPGPALPAAGARGLPLAGPPSFATGPALASPTLAMGAPAASRAPLVLLAAGGLLALLVGSIVVALLVVRRGTSTLPLPLPVSTPTPPSDGAAEPLPGALPVADIHHVDPLELLPLARARARELEPTATLDRIDVYHVNGGRVDLASKDGNIVFHFRFAPRSDLAVSVMFWSNRVQRVDREDYGSASFSSASVEPRCSLAQAWNAVVQAGKTPRAGGYAAYTRSHAYHETWAIDAATPDKESYVVNGQSCVLEGTASTLPVSAFESPSPPSTTPRSGKR